MLAELLEQAGLPEPATVEVLTGRGFTDEVSVVGLPGTKPVVLRRWAEARELEFSRACFLADHAVPAPRLLAASRWGTLVEFVGGRLLGDLIEDAQDSATAWRAVGAAYRRVHDVGFPSGLAGRLGPYALVLRPVDPVAGLHELLENATAGLHRRLPEALVHLDALHGFVDRCAPSLRAAATALLHGDVNMWNVLVDTGRAVLIDWDLPEVGDPAMEIALLDKHAHLFNGTGLPDAFFEGYGPSAEPNTALHRIVQTIQWVASDDWDGFASEAALPTALRTRAQGWLDMLQQYLRALPEHLDRLSGLIEAEGSPGLLRGGPPVARRGR